MDNVTPFPGKPNELAVGLEEMKRDIGLLREFKKLNAELKWAYYCALRDEGFSEEQALELVKYDDDGI